MIKSLKVGTEHPVEEHLPGRLRARGLVSCNTKFLKGVEGACRSMPPSPVPPRVHPPPLRVLNSTNSSGLTQVGVPRNWGPQALC